MADVDSFERAFLERLKRERMMFISEIFVLGREHGLTEVQISRILHEAEVSGLGFSEVAFVYAKS